jgi:hypothetical protein
MPPLLSMVMILDGTVAGSGTLLDRHHFETDKDGNITKEYYHGLVRVRVDRPVQRRLAVGRGPAGHAA